MRIHVGLGGLKRDFLHDSLLFTAEVDSGSEQLLRLPPSPTGKYSRLNAQTGVLNNVEPKQTESFCQTEFGDQDECVRFSDLGSNTIG